MNFGDVLGVIFPTQVFGTKAAINVGKSAVNATKKPQAPDMSAFNAQLEQQRKDAEAQRIQLSDQLRARRAVLRRGSSTALLYQGLLGTRQSLGG